MDWKDVASKIGSAAPILGTILGGPLGGAAGALASKLVSSALGTDATPDAVNTALMADPDALAKVRQAELDAQVQLRQLATQQAVEQMHADSLDYQTEVDDRKNARDRAEKMNDHFPNWMASLITVGFFGILYAMLQLDIPESNKPILYIMIGSLGTAWTSAMSYIYGSTRAQASQNAKITDFATAPGAVTNGTEKK